MKFGLRAGALALLTISGSCGFWACSDHRVAGGNSAESGNPELVGILSLPSGKPAQGALLQCVPAGFVSLRGDTLTPNLQTVSDSTGSYSFDSLPAGSYSLEAYHQASGLRTLVRNVTIVEDSRATIDRSLQNPGTLRLGASGLSDGDSVWVYVAGTSILRHVVVKFGSIFVDSLPADSLNFTVFIPASGDSLLAPNVPVVSGDTVKLNAPNIHVSFRVALNTSATGANLQDTLYAFPLALRMDASRIDFTVISPAAGRFHIFKADSVTELPYQISHWDAVSNTAQFWVRLDTLFPQLSSQRLVVVYDEGDTTTQQFSRQPFAGADGFLGVWHFDEDKNTATDASSNANDGVPEGVAMAAGVVGQGFQFDGYTSHVTIPNSAAGVFNFDFVDTMSFSVWVKLTNPNTSRFVVGKGNYQYYLKYLYPEGWLFENNELQTSGAYRYWYQMPFDTLTDVGQWILLTVVQQGLSTSLYCNGVLVDSSAAVGTGTQDRNTINDLEIGRQQFPDLTAGQHFEGFMDEVHFSSVARSSSWVRMTYLNQIPVGYWPQ